MAGSRRRAWALAAPAARGALLGAAIAAGPAPAFAGGAGPAAGAGRDASTGNAGAQAVRPSPFSDILAREATSRGLPPALADAVAFVESGYDAGAVGSVGELGLMQVRPATAAMLGHRGPDAQLLDPATNARFGVAYLAEAWRLAGGDLCRALAKYRAGHGAERLTPRSVEYCRRARDRLAETGSPLAAAVVPAATSLAPPGSRSAAPSARSMRPAVATLANRFWAEHVARIRAVEARSDRIMRGG
jgi:soluble lytic murein transglycosylase-like protein